MARGGKREGAGRKPGAVSKAKRDLAEMAKEHAEAALETLVTINVKGTSETARISAAREILDRGYGKPPQSLEHTGKDGSDLIPDRAPREIARLVLALLRKAASTSDEPDRKRPASLGTAAEVAGTDSIN